MSNAWARSGGMWLTGRADGPPLEVAGDPAGLVAATLARLRSPALPGVTVLGERAAYLGLRRRGARTAGGAGRLLPAADGWVAVSLARHTDLELLPALVEHTIEDPWNDLAGWIDRTPTTEIIDRAVLLGLPIAAVPAAPPPPRRSGVIATGGGAAKPIRRQPRILDLSSLWAGPLCAHLLGLLGADVVKVESSRRPDGARRGHPAFFDLLHAGHRSVALDFNDAGELGWLRELAARADLVIEGSRPRALRQLGMHAEDTVASGVNWLSITAYGRGTGDEARVGFGDDVAASAGLVAWDQHGPVFAADALADPLTGVVAAAAAARALAQPDATLVDVSMHDVATEAARLPWTKHDGPAAAPWPRNPAARAATLGVHTREVFDTWT